MTNKPTDNTDKVDQQADVNPLMATYNPLPLQPEQPAHFYWQEHEASTVRVRPGRVRKLIPMSGAVNIYDTTLRDGAQGEGVSFSVEDKVQVAQRLDDVGIHYIEGGWPGSNAKDVEFFAAFARSRSSTAG